MEIDGSQSTEDTSFQTSELIDALSRRTIELEDAQRQLLALRLDASLSAGFVAELQQTVAEATMRAQRAEHELHMLRLAQGRESLDTMLESRGEEERAQAQMMRSLFHALAAMRS